MVLRLRIVAFGSIFGAICGVLPFPASAQTLQLQPSTISSISPGFTAQARLVLTNPGPDPLSKISLSQFSNDGITIKFPARKPATLPSKGQIEWPIAITVPASAHLPGTVVFDATYSIGSVVNHQYAALALQSDATLKNFDAALDGTPDPVSEQRPSAIYLILTNNMDVPAQVNVSFDVSEADLNPLNPMVVFAPPRSTSAQKIPLSAPSRITPGNHTLAVNVDATWDRNGTKETRHFALTKPVTVGIFFESELLKVLSIPSFLVLPGCLLIFTMQLLLSTGFMNLKDSSRIPTLTVASAGFWVLAIPVSAAFLAIYDAIFHVNLLLAYGAQDLVYMWVASIPIGFVLYVFFGAISWYSRRRHVFSTSDSPLDVLEKLNNNKLTLERPQVKYKMNGIELFGLALEEIRDGQTLLWVVPHILADWSDGEAAAKLKRKYNKIVNETRDPESLLEALKDSATLVALKFEKRGVVPNPYHVKIDAITDYPGPGVLTQTDVETVNA